MQIKVKEVHDYFIYSEFLDFGDLKVEGATTITSVKDEVKVGDILEYNKKTFQFEKV